MLLEVLDFAFVLLGHRMCAGVLTNIGLDRAVFYERLILCVQAGRAVSQGDCLTAQSSASDVGQGMATAIPNRPPCGQDVWAAR
jgi:hypothetical protein